MYGFCRSGLSPSPSAGRPACRTGSSPNDEQPREEDRDPAQHGHRPRDQTSATSRRFSEHRRASDDDAGSSARAAATPPARPTARSPDVRLRQVAGARVLGDVGQREVAPARTRRAARPSPTKVGGEAPRKSALRAETCSRRRPRSAATEPATSAYRASPRQTTSAARPRSATGPSLAAMIPAVSGARPPSRHPSARARLERCRGAWQRDRADLLLRAAGRRPGADPEDLLRLPARLRLEPVRHADGAGRRRRPQREPAEPVHDRSTRRCSISATSG